MTKGRHHCWQRPWLTGGGWLSAARTHDDLARDTSDVDQSCSGARGSSPFMRAVLGPDAVSAASGPFLHVDHVCHFSTPAWGFPCEENSNKGWFLYAGKTFLHEVNRGGAG